MLSALLTVSAVTSVDGSAKYYAGTPAVMRGHWRTKMKKVSVGHGRYVWRYLDMTVSKKKISGGVIGHAKYGGIKLKYQSVKSQGIQLYLVQGWWFGLPRKVRYFGVYSSPSKNILFETPGGVEKTVTWYRYSGRHSKRTFYPYP